MRRISGILTLVVVAVVALALWVGETTYASGPSYLKAVVKYGIPVENAFVHGAYSIYVEGSFTDTVVLQQDYPNSRSSNVITVSPFGYQTGTWIHSNPLSETVPVWGYRLIDRVDHRSSYRDMITRWNPTVCSVGPQMEYRAEYGATLQDSLATLIITNTTSIPLYVRSYDGWLTQPDRPLAPGTVMAVQSRRWYDHVDLAAQQQVDWRANCAEFEMFLLDSDPTTVTPTPTATPPAPTPSPTPDPSIPVVYSLEKHPNRDQIWIVQGQQDLSRVWTLLRGNGQVRTNQEGNFHYQWESSDWGTVQVSPVPTCESSELRTPCPYDHALLLGLKPGTARVGVNVLSMVNGTYHPVGGGNIVASATFTVNVISPVENPPSPPALPAEIPVQRGWTLVGGMDGIPSDATGLVSEMNRLGFNARQVTRWENGAWHSYLPGFSATFPIERGRGYFVRTEGSGIWRVPR